MKKITKIYFSVLTIAAGFFTHAIAQQPLKVLFIGNSFTYANDLPGKFKGLVTAAGLSVTTDSYATPGATVYGSGGHATNPAVYAKINSQAWDYVVIQDNQGAFSDIGPYISQSVIDANMRLRDSVRNIHPCSSVIWFAGWGPKGGEPAYVPGDNSQKLINRVDTNYQFMNNEYPAKKEVIAPFGKAWIASIAGKPALNLWASDNVHPGVAGQLLNASVLFTSVFKQDPSNVNYNGGINAADAAFLRNTGYKTVINASIYSTHNLASITPVVNFSSGVLTTASGYSGYQWYLNNVLMAGATSATYTPASSGNYCVIATQNGCAHYLSFPFATTATGIHESMTNENILFYPNPVTDVSVIDMKEMRWQGGSIEIINLTGQTIRSQPLSSDKYFIDKNDFRSGMYFYRISDKAGNSFTGKMNVL